MKEGKRMKGRTDGRKDDRKDEKRSKPLHKMLPGTFYHQAFMPILYFTRAHTPLGDSGILVRLKELNLRRLQ